MNKDPIIDPDNLNTKINISSRAEMLKNLESANLTFQINGEDHTLGNIMRHLAMLNPSTTFAGYAIPHPSISSMNLRIETVSNVDYGKEDQIFKLEDKFDDTKKTKQDIIIHSNNSINNLGGRPNALGVLRKACKDLLDICDTIEMRFDEAIHNFSHEMRD
ncbi:DNA-directed RNA polymerases I and III subunit RPAC2, putative [Cryptosporidium muris RN66]|uniref:DNA-directed RNA polymerases I and III subunit RPAC2, putative n=1 Tax=Cryptosporidium muris (strain RN66) TaxID=441375 RepID=B6AD73_CRYMR|nr:DNA-directed RNA polymerases I and III subunit RPAC2, putative [Cryptosporidium muris RN66]EEA06077.1 DNA-directed RNA polymerases I and III subunit RPAC2, putative [Cryptosporidium muris RN66]|eukprot:XP_002140426.1 DNA-directed RNA polymerases I and III subunit RPAC2 [Cryptosporidium muris RN66]